MIRQSLKKHFPSAFEIYKHIQHRLIIWGINKRKQMSVLECLNWLSQQYMKFIGHNLDWNNLQTYTEKMQWEKIYDDNPQKVTCADKYLVKSWISDKIGEEYLIPILGVWNKFDDIDFDALPNKFVLKANHGSGANVIVKDKYLFSRD